MHGAFGIAIAGVVQTNAVMDIRTVVMPALYVAGGDPIDLSAAFSAITEVQILRAYVTSSGAPDTRVYAINQTGTDTFANRKFRMQAMRGGSLTHTHGNANCDGANHVSGVCVVPGAQVTTVPTVALAEVAAGAVLNTITVVYAVFGVHV